jgi:hypothetical protein
MYICINAFLKLRNVLNVENDNLLLTTRKPGFCLAKKAGYARAERKIRVNVYDKKEASAVY